MSSIQSTWSGAPNDQRQRIERALSYTSTSNPGLLQTFINRTIQQLTLREFGLQAVLPRRPGSGDAVYVNQRAGLTPGATWIASAAVTVAEATGTYTQRSFPYKTLCTRGQVARQLRAMGRTYGDTLAIEMVAKAEDYANTLESALVIGDTATSANMPNGFITMIQGAVVGTGGAALTQTVINRNLSDQSSVNLSQLDECIDLVKGSANRGDCVIVGSFAGLRQLNKVLQANQRFMEYGEIKAGFRVRQYDGIPMVVSTGMPNDLNFNTTTGACTGYSAASYSALMVLNTRDCYISELTNGL